MRVGLFTYGMDRQLTGIGRYARELAYALRRVDPAAEVILLSPYPRSPLAWYRDFPVVSLPSLGRLPAVLATGPRLLDRAARQAGLEIFHDPCGIAPFLPRPGPYGRVVTIHDAIPLLAPHLQPLLTNMVYRTLIPAARVRADAVITVSQAARDDLVRTLSWDPARVTVIPEGCSVHPATRRAPGGDGGSLPFRTPFVLFVGAVSPRKNLETALDAVGRLNEQGVPMQLWIAGPDTGHRRRLLRHPAAKWCRVLDFVNDETLAALYSRAVALVYPSLQEGFGLPVVEAMACGCPVICSDIPVLQETAGDAACLVNPQDTRAWAAAMVRLVVDPAYRRELVTRGLTRVALFSWTQHARRTLEVYEAVLRGRSLAKAGSAVNPP
jgi:glycosyltransferase involved in cell wall biosynthesis